MPGFKNVITSKSGTVLLYATNGLPVFGNLPKSSITGLSIEGPFLNTSFRPKARAEMEFEGELISLIGANPTETKVRAAFDRLKAKHRGTEAKPAPKRAKATVSVKKAPKEKQAAVPSMDEMDRAKFDAAMKIMQDLLGKFETKVA